GDPSMHWHTAHCLALPAPTLNALDSLDRPGRLENQLHAPSFFSLPTSPSSGSSTLTAVRPSSTGSSHIGHLPKPFLKPNASMIMATAYSFGPMPLASTLTERCRQTT